jgi:hypothetical protein
MEKDCYQEIIAEVSKKLAEKFRWSYLSGV